MKRIALTCLMAASGVWLAGCATTGPHPAATDASGRMIDARADDALKQMTTYLAQLQSFRFAMDVTYDDYFIQDALKVQFAKHTEVAIQRPNRATGVTQGDADDRRTWYDGKSLTMLDLQARTYAQIPAPDTLDATINMMADKYGYTMPVGDLLVGNAHDALMKDVQYAYYVGEHSVGGVKCHHLAFEQPSLNWQIWIDAGAQPLPRKLVVTYKSLPGWPQYEATFTNWQPTAAFGPSEFTAAIPADTIQIEMPAQSGQPR